MVSVAIKQICAGLSKLIKGDAKVVQLKEEDLFLIKQIVVHSVATKIG